MNEKNVSDKHNDVLIPNRGGVAYQHMSGGKVPSIRIVQLPDDYLQSYKVNADNAAVCRAGVMQNYKFDHSTCPS